MAQRQGGWLSELFTKAVFAPAYKAISWIVDKGIDWGPNVYVPSRWAEPSRQYDNTPTGELIAAIDRAKVIHLQEFYQIADALSWENGQYFVSKKDTLAFLYPFSSELARKASDGLIESWCHKDCINDSRSVYYLRAGDLLDHLEAMPLPGDDWQVKTLEQKAPIFAGELRNRPLQLRKLMVVSALMADDQRPAMEANPGHFYHRPAGGPAPVLGGAGPSGTAPG